MPPVIAQPPKGAFHLPAVLHDLKPLAGVLDHFQVYLGRLLQAADPVAQPLRLLPSIDPDFPEAGHTRGKIALQQRDQAQPIIPMSSSNDHRHNQPQGIDQDMPFAPLAFLVPVKTDVLSLRRRLDTLASRTARGRFGQPSLALAFPLVPRLHHPCPDPIATPASEGAIDRMPIADIRGHHAPLAPRLVDIENAIDDAAEVDGFPPCSPRTPLG